MSFSYSMAVDDINKKVIINGKTEDLGKLFLDFLELDLAKYNRQWEKINDVLTIDNVPNKKIMEEAVPPNTNRIRGVGREMPIINGKNNRINRPFSEQLPTNLGNMPLKDKYATIALHKALGKIQHPYFDILDYNSVTKFDYKEMLELFNLVEIQNNYKSAMNDCLLKPEKYKILSPVERLEKSRLLIKGKAEVLFEISENMTLNEVYIAFDVSSFLYVEFMKMIQNNVLVGICKNCGNYFLQLGNYDMKYCNREPLGGEKSCQEIGAFNSFKEKVKTDPIYTEYEKVYKRYFARKRKGLISEENFKAWSENASKLKKEAINGNLSLVELLEQIEVFG